jgi:hypothetical protein
MLALNGSLFKIPLNIDTSELISKRQNHDKPYTGKAAQDPGCVLTTPGNMDSLEHGNTNSGKFNNLHWHIFLPVSKDGSNKYLCPIPSLSPNFRLESLFSSHSNLWITTVPRRQICDSGPEENGSVYSAGIRGR